MSADNPDLRALVRRQLGLVTHRQAIGAGLSILDVRKALDTGRWRTVLRGVYLTTRSELSDEQKRLAVSLYTVGVGQITGLSALAWHGLRDLPEGYTLVHVLVPHSSVRRTSDGFVRIQRTRPMDPHAHDTGRYVVCSPARAVSDACRTLCDPDAISAIITQAVHRRRTTVGALRRELELAGSSNTRNLRQALNRFHAEQSPPRPPRPAAPRGVL